MRIKMEWSTDPDDLRVIQQELLRDIESKFGAVKRQNFGWVLRDSLDDLVIGGVSGFVHWNWAYISQLWVQPKFQGFGYGSKLINEVYLWSVQNPLSGLYIDTFEEKVKDFYLKNSFNLMGSIPDFPPGYQRFFLYRKI